MSSARELHIKKQRAAFLDRDGVINPLVHHRDSGIINSPSTLAQFRLFPGAAAAVKRLNRLGLKVVVVSNQPGVARRHFSPSILSAMTRKMERLLARGGALLDAVYYCPHHPGGRGRRYAIRCGCRKPKPGLLTRAAGDLNIDLRKSFMIGDSLTDIQAGHAAGCTTILLGYWKCDLCKFLHSEKARPDHIEPDLVSASKLIERLLRR